MIEHLTDEQWSAALAGAPGEEAVAHLHACRACAAEYEWWHSQLGSVRDGVRRAAELPEAFWQRQRANISARVLQQRSARGRLVWAGAMATVALSALLLAREFRPAPVTQMDPDQELLLSIEQSVQRGMPAALEPAALLTDDMVAAAKKKSKSRLKEGNR
jgi:hypothetical protein